MKKFKDGDIVRFVDRFTHRLYFINSIYDKELLPFGSVGVVINSDIFNTGWITVHFFNGEKRIVYCDFLKLVKEKDN